MKSCPLYHLGVWRKQKDLDHAQRSSADIHTEKDQWALWAGRA